MNVSELIAAAATPYREDGSADTILFAAHARRLLAAGCDGVLVGGSTGEAASLTLRERVDQLEQVGQADIPAEQVIAGIGSCCLPDTIELVKTSLMLGIRRFLWCPPFYYTPADSKGLIAFLQSVFAVPGTRQVQLLLYHIPRYTGVPFTADLVERLVERFPGQIAGIKDSGGDIRHTRQLIERFPRLSVYSGTEKSADSLIRSGMTGVISATFNLGIAPVGDRKESPGTVDTGQLSRLEKRRESLEEFPLIPAVKSLLAEVDGLTAWDRIRPPLMGLKPEAVETVRKQIRSETWIDPLRQCPGDD